MREVVIVFDVGGIESTVVVLCLIVTRVAGNGFGPTGGEHIGLALRELTGLQTLDLEGTCLLCCFDGGVALYCGGGREGVCDLR